MSQRYLPYFFVHTVRSLFAGFEILPLYVEYVLYGYGDSLVDNLTFDCKKVCST